jgi:hypothetical protein
MMTRVFICFVPVDMPGPWYVFGSPAGAAGSGQRTLRSVPDVTGKIEGIHALIGRSRFRAAPT